MTLEFKAVKEKIRLIPEYQARQFFSTPEPYIIESYPESQVVALESSPEFPGLELTTRYRVSDFSPERSVSFQSPKLIDVKSRGLNC